MLFLFEGSSTSSMMYKYSVSYLQCPNLHYSANYIHHLNKVIIIIIAIIIIIIIFIVIIIIITIEQIVQIAVFEVGKSLYFRI